MVFDRETAARRAEAAVTNTPGMCQAWTDAMFGAPAVGDFDGNGHATAIDGWASEHGHQHPGDRNPPRGTPVAYSGGSAGSGHRAVSLGNGKIRSTDAAGEGHVATVDLNWPEVHWGLHYLGWSDTVSGIPIPKPTPPPPPRPTSRGKRVEGAITDLENAKGKGSGRQKKIQRALDILKRIKKIR